MFMTKWYYLINTLTPYKIDKVYYVIPGYGDLEVISLG